MRLCTECFWYNDGLCMEKNAEVVSPVDGKRKHRSCEVQRGYSELPDSCGKEGRFWLDAEIDTCSICHDPIMPSESQVGDDEPMHLNCAVGKAESAFEGDR